MQGGEFRMLHLVRPYLRYLPQAECIHSRKITFKEKFVFTAASLFIFRVCSQFPLYGIDYSTFNKFDTFYWMRAILATSPTGTVMGLGISPIVTSGMIMSFLASSKLIQVNNRIREDLELFNGAQKLLGVLIAVGQAVTYVLSGMYGNVGFVNALLIITQLSLAGVIVMCLDELFQKGYGLVSSASSLFVTANICENIIWKAFDPATVNSGSGGAHEFIGALVALFHLIISRTDKISAIREAFFREHLPNVTNLLATIFIFLIVVYLQCFHVALKVRSKGAASSYPIKLFYTSNMPVILQSALVSNLCFVSHFLHKRYNGNNNFLVNLMGKWKESGQLNILIGGLSYYVTAPASLADMAADPIHAMFYLVFMLATCALLSKTWIRFSGSSARDVAKQLKEQNMGIHGHKDSSLEKKLNRNIPIAAALGGMCIGALTVAADLMGAMGSGAGILLAVTIIYQCWETYEEKVC
ncbi:putative SecY/SEC61-alpha family protein [Rosa chinensis]|uniref:Putative SecY/SEC61-alpha family protein n=1 Tax=Rosa chinensis TaxID=74649 RepID=A0A2P6RLK5_ROSCH|nr:protein transport protein Sec61 subunit alpha [Rosa chinensis]PRQ47316.1 putative SecY/SEC61-alpha family protein [Rosa chinensis]